MTKKSEMWKSNGIFVDSKIRFGNSRIRKPPGGGLPMAGGLGVGARATPSPPRMETKKPFPLWGLGFFDCHSLLSLVRQADERDIHGAYGGDVEANPVTVTMSGTQIAICAG